MNTYPANVKQPSLVFSDEPSDKAVLVANMDSGYPVLNKLFTFDPRTFVLIRNNVLQADKIAIMTFYENNKDVPFYWLNKQDDITYEVIYISRPDCILNKQKDRWRITEKFTQSSAETS